MNDENLETAARLGLDADRLLRVKKTVETDTTKGLYDGAVFLIARQGEVVMHEAVGRTDLADKRPARLDDVFFIMSITKTLTAGVVFEFIERGLLTLTTPIAEIIPEFGIKGKQRVTVAHILTHTGGMSSGIPPLLPLEQFGNLQAFVAAACQEPLVSVPGRQVSYSPIIGHAILAEMIRRLDGGRRPFRRILAEELLQPLRMNDTSLGLRPDLASRRVPIVYRDLTPGLFEPLVMESLNLLMTEETEIPAGGGLSTAADLFRWAECLLRGGELDGTRVLAPALIELAITNHTGEEPNGLFDHTCELHGWDRLPSNLGLSFFLRGEGLHPMPFGLTASPATFGGLGAGSTMFWVDPDRDLIFVLLTAGLMEEGNAFLRHQRLSDLVLAAVVD